MGWPVRKLFSMAAVHTRNIPGNNGVNASGPDWVAIPDNQNDLNRDYHNPYAYPYFHSDGVSVCLLYDLVVEFAAIGNNNSEDYEAASTHPTPSSYFDMSQGQRRLVRRVEARCMTHPHEILWADSCGDTALHRLAQIARLSGPDSSYNNNLSWILKMAKCIVSANPEAVSAQNNWKETPLHQFAQHCGLPKVWSYARDDDSLWYYENFGRKECSRKKDSLVALATLLASLGAASLTNYQGSTALHEAVQLSLVKPSVLPNMYRNQHHSDRLRNYEMQQQQQFQSQHIDIVHLLIQASPEAMISANMHHYTPWMLALQATRTCPQVLQVLLDSEHRHHYNFHHHTQPTSSVKKLIFRRQASYALCKFQFPSTSTTGGKADDESHDYEGFWWEKTQYIARQFSDRRLHGLILAGAPLQTLTLALKIVPRDELLLRDSTTGCRPLELLLQQRRLRRHTLNKHLLRQHGYSYNKQAIDEWNDDSKGLVTSDAILKLVIETNPRVASVSCGQSHGVANNHHPETFPLHLSLQLQSKVDHRDVDAASRCSIQDAFCKLPWTWSGSLRTLFRAYPMAVGYRDATNGFFPYQMAAIHARSDPGNDVEDLDYTTMVYCLLRADPSVLRSTM